MSNYNIENLLKHDGVTVKSYEEAVRLNQRLHTPTPPSETVKIRLSLEEYAARAARRSQRPELPTAVLIVPTDMLETSTPDCIHKPFDKKELVCQTTSLPTEQSSTSIGKSTVFSRMVSMLPKFLQRILKSSK